MDSDGGESALEVEVRREGDVIGEELPCRRRRGEDDFDGGGGGGGYQEEGLKAMRNDTPDDVSYSNEENIDDASNIDTGVDGTFDGAMNTTAAITNNTVVKFRSVQLEDIHTIEDVPVTTMPTDPEEKNENDYTTERNTIESLWYTDKEYFFIKKEAMNIVRRRQCLNCDDSLDDDNDDDDDDGCDNNNPSSYGRRTSTRGLEIVDADSKRRRETIIKKAVSTVIETQQEHKKHMEKQRQQQQQQQQQQQEQELQLASHQQAMTIATKYHDCVVECESEVEARNRARQDEQDAHDYLHNLHGAIDVNTTTENGNKNRTKNVTTVVTSQKQKNKLADAPSLHQRIKSLVDTSFGRGSLGKRRRRKSAKLYPQQAQSEPQPQPQKQQQKQERAFHRKMDSTSTTVSVSSSTSTPHTPPSFDQQKEKRFVSRILLFCRVPNCR